MAKFRQTLHAVGFAAQFALSDSDCMKADSWGTVWDAIDASPRSDWLFGLGRLIRNAALPDIAASA